MSLGGLQLSVPHRRLPGIRQAVKKHEKVFPVAPPANLPPPPCVFFLPRNGSARKRRLFHNKYLNFTRLPISNRGVKKAKTFENSGIKTRTQEIQAAFPSQCAVCRLFLSCCSSSPIIRMSGAASRRRPFR